MRRPAMVAVALLAVGCGGSDPPVQPRLTVAAPRSLAQALTPYARHFGADLRFVSSAALTGSHRPDVIAATALPHDGLVEKPRAFAVDKLVLAVPAGGQRRVRRVEDMAKPGVRIAVPPAATTAGRYARRVVARLPAAAAANLRTSSHGLDDVQRGRADAAIVFYTMAKRAEVLPIDFWDSLRPRVTYEVAVVKGTPLPAQARAFVHGLRRGAGRDAVIRAGLTPR